MVNNIFSYCASLRIYMGRTGLVVAISLLFCLQHRLAGIVAVVY